MSFRREFRPMLSMAAPLALAELGGMAMGIADTIMAGPFGPAAVGAGSLGNLLFYPIGICAAGLLLGMDTLVAQSFGAEDHDDCCRTLVNGVWLAVGLTPLVVALNLALIPLLDVFGTNPHVLAHFGPYLRALQWGVLPLLLYTAFRRYLQAVNIVKPVTFALLSANAVNIAGNWWLMYRLGMGLEGSGYSTSIARVYLALALVATAFWHGVHAKNWRPQWERIRRLISLGLPAAGQIAFEGSVWAGVTVMAAKLDEVALAAHGIAIQVVATTYMVPYGISSAAAVRVGHAFGRGDPKAAKSAALAAMTLSGLFMAAAGIALWAVPGFIVGRFIADPNVIAAGTPLLRIAAFFELFDGFQTTALGALRGFGDTRTPMLAHLIGYWAFGMPVSYLLCFWYGWGAPGLWVGLTVALILIGVALTLSLLAR